MANETQKVSPMTNEGDKTAQVPPAMDEGAVNDIVEMVNLLASAKDAMSDEMVARLARTASEGITLLDRLTRNEGLMRLLQVLDRPDCQYLLIGLADALSDTSRDLATAPPAKGGMGGMLHLARQAGTQEGVRMVSLLGQHLSERMRELHRRGG